MSRSNDRIQATIRKLLDRKPQVEVEGRFAHGTELDIHEDLLLSVIIPARNEFPNIAHTVHSILNAWEADGYNWRDIEIIIVDNCSDERSTDSRYYTHPLDFGTSTYLMGRGIYVSRILRVHYDPLAGNHSARNKGAEIARGKYVFFSDAHMSYGPNFFKRMIQATEESGGLVHAAIAWMGGYPARDGSLGIQYTIKLGEEIKGTWAPYLVSSDKWFYIAAQGHCSVMCNRKQFLAFGGYPKVHRSYGGGEFYLNMKWWMLGSTVAVVPNAVGYHLKSFRGYVWYHQDYVHNVMNTGWALSMDDWLERAYINWLRTNPRDVMERMLVEAKREMQKDREWIAEHQKKSFNEILLERPWDRLNDTLHGRHNSSVLIFHDTWLACLDSMPLWLREMYENSPGQKRLAQFINDNLAEHVYRRGYERPGTNKKEA